MAEHDRHEGAGAEHDSDISSTDDVNFEPEAELGNLAAAHAKLKKLKAELEKVKAERQQYLDGWQRCKADSVNVRKEAESRASRTAEALREALVHDIIPALDSFDLAAGSESWGEVSDGWKKGMELVRDQLLDALRRHGIERCGKVGEAFNALRHETVEERADLAGEPGSVVKILRYGYRAGERVLRPAHVIIKSSV
ncbi:MAG: nucleotide exchange factor GrpE [Candidatus Kaiserbacteria bacterium]|nr:MAG: nucleotide exchange factor GrpE [Candidatus Kaiserbacteria bacterium]